MMNILDGFEKLSRMTQFTIITGLPMVVGLILFPGEGESKGRVHFPAKGDEVGQAVEVKISVPGQFAALPALDTLNEMVDRPLFASNRRPLVDVFANGERREFVIELPPEPRLQGTLVSQSGIVGLFAIDGKKKLVKAKTGDRIAGWNITKLTEHNATVISFGQRRNLAMNSLMAATE